MFFGAYFDLAYLPRIYWQHVKAQCSFHQLDLISDDSPGHSLPKTSLRFYVKAGVELLYAVTNKCTLYLKGLE